MRTLGRVLGFVLVVCVIPLACVMAIAGSSRWGALEVLGLVLLGAALVSRWKRRSSIALGALAALAALVLVRWGITSSNERARVRTPGGARFVNAVVDEEDASRSATLLLPLTGFSRDPDLPRLGDAMKDGYARMRDDAGDVSSPVLATYLGLESPGAFDTIAIGDPNAETVLVFLHGFAGSFTLPCWQIGAAVRDLGVRTVCPATTWRGDWWSPDGERTLRAALAAERARGAKRFLLAGLSNGGIGASILAPRMPGAFAALVLVSGADSSAPPAFIPTLVLQGTRDAMVSTAAVEQYAARANAERAYIDAGHFVLLVEHERAERAIARFVSKRVKPRSTTASFAPPRE